MAKIKPLVDKNGESFYPVVNSQGVYSPNGRNLDKELELGVFMRDVGIEVEGMTHMDADSLNGHTFDYFATKDELEDVKESIEDFVSTGDITDATNIVNYDKVASARQMNETIDGTLANKLKKTNTNITNLTNDVDAFKSGLENKTTVLNADGTITETKNGGVNTIVLSGNTVTETFVKNGVTKTKTTTINGNTITEVIS